MQSKFINAVQEFVPFLRTRNRPSPQQVLRLRPIRNPSIKWERSEQSGLVVLLLENHPFRSWDKMIGKIFQIPTQRRIEMSDELSSLVWELCDGTHTVASIAGRIATEYKLTLRQAEVSVLAFLNTLQGKHLVGVPPDQATEVKQSGSNEPPSNVKGHKGLHATRKQRSASRVARERGH